MLGLILCGGQSSRMGSDKGLLKLEANTWAQTALDKMAVLKIPVKISINNRQYSDYASVFPATDLIVDDDSMPVKGPLAGVLSCHVKFPEEDIFILACDMPMMNSFLLQNLYDHSRQKPSSQAYVYGNEGEPEPLCGLYRASGLAVIMKLLNEGKLEKQSMKCMLDHMETSTIALTQEEKRFFRNFNAHAELNGL